MNLKKSALITAIMFVVSALHVSAQQWFSDSIGHGYEMRYIDLGTDYSGSARCSLVRRMTDKGRSDKAVLYIHGYNDYFFQTEMGIEFNAHGYNFYALDLRRYGRSLRPGDKPFVVRNFDDYSQDVDSALRIMRQAGNDTIVLMGHSTGGLLAAYYVARHPDAVNYLILNSPFLDWNLGKKECLVGLVSALGRVFPNISVSTGGGGVYAQSLEKEHHGEWTYNESKKSTDYGVDLGWVRAVNNAQEYLSKHQGDIKIPILLMSSSRSSDPQTWSQEAMETDVVLDVNDIRKYGKALGPDVTSVAVEGGMHDLLLSQPGVRAAVYKYIFYWLDKEFASHH